MKESTPSRKRTEEELKSSLAKLHDLESIINRSPVIYCIWKMDESATVEYISANIEQFGYTRDDFLSGKVSWYGITHPVDVPRLQDDIRENVRRKQWQFDQTYRIFDKQGNLHWVEDQTTLIFENPRLITHAQGTIMDVTDRKLAEFELRKSEDRLRELLYNSSDIIIIIDADGIIKYISPSVEGILNYKPEDVTGKKVFDFIHPDRVSFTVSYHNAVVMKQEKTNIGEHLVRHADGSWIPLEVLAKNCLDNPSINGIVLHCRNITERKRMASELHKSEERLQELLLNSSDVITLADQEGIIRYISPSVKTMLHHEAGDLLGKEGFAYVHPDDLETAAKAFAAVLKQENKGIPSQFRFRAGNGSWTNVEVLARNCLDNPAIKGIILSIRDVSERKRMEEQLLQAQKMESIGRLAGGIAHDFNNLLMGIQGYISLLLLDTDAFHPHFEKLINIQTLVQNGADLTGKLLGFARGGKYELKATNLNALIAKTVDLFGQTKKEISVHQKLEGDIWTVEVDRTQIGQVILNLLVNAWQAMPHGGDIYVETKNEFLRSFSASHPATGKYVMIKVSDTGTGMDEETRRQIFEPFFTTKDKKRGVGLGLASVYGIIKEHKGSIDVASKPGSGTVFTIYLPASDKEIPLEAQTAKSILKGTETLLLVDDESAIVDVCRDILIHLGYKIFTASSGGEALNIYAAHQNEIDLVILDMIMPGLSGQDTFNALKQANPQIKVILSSGYSLTDQAQKIMDSGCLAFIQKPFRLDDLSLKIREVLDQSLSA